MVGFAVVGASVGCEVEGASVGEGVGCRFTESIIYESQNLLQRIKDIKYSKATLSFLPRQLELE